MTIAVNDLVRLKGCTETWRVGMLGIEPGTHYRNARIYCTSDTGLTPRTVLLADLTPLPDDAPGRRPL